MRAFRSEAGGMPNDDRVLVYSTDGSLPLPKSGRAKLPVQSGRKAPPDDGIVRVGCEKRRSGSMTLVYGLPAASYEVTGKELRRRCGTGGTSKDGVVELQGDHRDAVIAYLSAKGTRAKKMGG